MPERKSLKNTILLYLVKVAKSAISNILVIARDYVFGILQVYHNGQWGMVSRNSFEWNDVHSACRRLGFIKATNYGHDGRGDGSVLRPTSKSRNSVYPVSMFICIPQCHCNIHHNAVYYKGQWGTVCNDIWGWNHANVTCRQLGFTKAASYWGWGRGEGTVWLDYMACTGSEASLQDCPHNGWGVVSSNCNGHTEDASVHCDSTDTRGYVFGAIQVYYKGQWGTVCSDYWGSNDANVACRQLGFTKAVGSWVYGRGEGPIWLDNMACTGSEASLGDCSHPGWGVVSSGCKTHTIDAIVQFSGYCYYSNGQWGTVCYNSWGMDDTKVACRQLGFTKALNYWGGHGEGPVWLDDMRCTGSEASLEDCSHPGWGVVSSNCNGHTSDAGVWCSSLQVLFRIFSFYMRKQHKCSYEPHIRALRSDTRGFVEGVIQVYHNGQWGTVCGDYWDSNDANVACRQLGFSKALGAWCCGEGGGEYPINSRGYGRGEGQVWLDSLKCTGSEATLWDCPHPAWGVVDPGCRSHTVDAMVECSVSQDFWSWEETKVACSQLGFTKAAYYWGSGHGEGPVWLDDMTCTGSEASLQDCSHPGWGNVSSHCNSHTYDAGVICSGSLLCNKDNEIYTRRAIRWSKIVNEKTTKSDTRGHVIGVIQVYYKGQWGTVCHDYWDINDAKVACRQLGFATAVSYGYDGHGEGPVWLDDMTCTGSEASLQDCSHPGWGVKIAVLRSDHS
ncbi:deleted in malignant brain tumors 1 protein-like [Actinia tenebrosa]|uniref:Deleted in malignant brain tumors 1 protein-like n=1 Tax=Actinia tenebrosa TaxID=6105 RepID=A0A6P8IHL9_ACTTE|nr:deleted in malignant brain tumors 1 protein-like [Actinia tenebrosa]